MIVYIVIKYKLLYNFTEMVSDCVSYAFTMFTVENVIQNFLD